MMKVSRFALLPLLLLGACVVPPHQGRAQAPPSEHGGGYPDQTAGGLPGPQQMSSQELGQLQGLLAKRTNQLLHNNQPYRDGGTRAQPCAPGFHPAKTERDPQTRKVYVDCQPNRR